MNKKNKKTKISIFCLGRINNIGDEILCDSTTYIIKTISKEIEVVSVQLIPGCKDVALKYKFKWILGVVLRKFSRLLPQCISYLVRNKAFILICADYYKSCIKNVDKVILPIGMLKYSTQNFSYLFFLINELCSRYNIPVMMSAMSPEPQNKADWRYRQLVKAVNMPSVKMITTRDGLQGKSIIENMYLKRGIPCDFVGDPALWIPECYRIYKKYNEGDIPHVGINIIREGIFDDYNKSFTDKELLHIYIYLIQLIDSKGWQWSLFTNGMKEDFRVVKKIQDKLKVPKERIFPIPKNCHEYVEQVSQFDVVFGSRLHSCITSVALGIPVVGFIWDNKLKYFSETMEISKYFFSPQSMTGEKIVHAMEDAMQFSFDTYNRDRYKYKTLESIRQFIDAY